MTHQAELFHDSIYDAITADVMAIGGVKKTAAMLWPTNSDAPGRLRACLSTEHPQKLDPEEVLSIKRLARDVGSFATITYESQTLAFTVEWIKDDEIEDKMQREFIDAVNRLERLAKARRAR